MPRSLRSQVALACLLTTAVGVALDLGSKEWVFSVLERGERRVLIPDVLNFVLSTNTGAAFGLFAGQWWFFVCVSVIAVSLLVYLVWSVKAPTTWWFGFGLGLLASGIVGNFYDRIVHGAVRDFIDLYVAYGPISRRLEAWVGTSHWPTFNVADVAILAGAGMVFVKFWQDDKRQALEAAEKQATARAPQPEPARGAVDG